jgi:hypothetical protein
MIAVEDPKFTWEIVGIYRAPNEDMRGIEILVAPNCLYRKFYTA